MSSTNTGQIEPTLTPWRSAFLALIPFITVAAVATAIHFGPNGWILHESWTSDGAMIWAPDHTGRIWCTELAASQPSAALEQIAAQLRATADYQARCGR